MIDESRVAQLVIQNVILVKQNQALHAKENKKEDAPSFLLMGLEDTYLMQNLFR